MLIVRQVQIHNAFRGLAARMLMAFVLLLCTALSASGHTPPRRACSPEPSDTLVNFDEIVGCELTPVGDIDTFRFAGTAGTTVAVQVTMKTGSFYPCLTVAFGTTQLISAPCKYGYTARQLILLPNTGTYTVRVWEDGYDAQMSYELYLQQLRPPVSVPAPLRYSVPVSSVIGYNAETHFHQFTGRAGDDAVIQVTKTGGLSFDLCLNVWFETEAVLPARTCNNGYIVRRELKLPKTGTYFIEVNESGFDNTFQYQVLVQCLGGVCSQPPGGWPSLTISRGGCTSCNPSSIFTARVTARACLSESELKIWFVLPDAKTLPIGSPHRELPASCYFSSEVYRAVLPPGPAGTWVICARLTHLNTADDFASTCSTPFRLSSVTTLSNEPSGAVSALSESREPEDIR
jgi:hypothetical protein